MQLISEEPLSSNSIVLEPGVDQLISLFNQLFRDTENTVLVASTNEPIYKPADTEFPYHRVMFAHGYFSSALHEIAHWCIAGQQRRLLEDYGYWYEPDGRSAQQQREFEQVEVKPQALEWLFSRASQRPFNVSFDNLNGESSSDGGAGFRDRVLRQVQEYLASGLPRRANMLNRALLDYYRPSKTLGPHEFTAEQLK